MYLSKLSLFSFRNHSEKNIDFSKGVTVIWGQNGSGKTSILEAITLLSMGKSFKTHKQKTIIKKGEKSFVVKGVFSSKNREETIAIQNTKQNKQLIKINGKKILTRKELIGKNNVVVLSPEDQKTTKGGPKERRLFFDRLFSIINTEYLNTLQKYNRILKQRNAWLSSFYKKQNNETTENQWDKQLVEVGVKLWTLRNQHFFEFKKELVRVIKRYNDQIKTDVFFSENILTKEQFQKKTKTNLKRDLVLKRTTAGPHKDNINILLFNKDIRDVGSQGEHKIILTLLKLTEMNIIKQKTGRQPTLLLDDLFSKLDLNKSKKLVAFLNETESSLGEPIQTIITTTDLVNIKNSGLLLSNKKINTHKLETNCNTLLAQ